MKSYRRTLGLVAAIAAFGALVPASASAQLGTNDLLGLLSGSSAEPGSASGSAANVGGLVVLNESSTDSSGSHVTVASVAGLELLGEHNGTNTGLLAPVASLTDAINEQTCPGGAATQEMPCLALVVTNTENTDNVNGASAALLALDTTGDGLNLVGSNAFSANADGACVDGAHGYVLISKKLFNQPNSSAWPLFTESSSAGPCP